MAVEKPKRVKPVERVKPAKKRPARTSEPIRGVAPAGTVGYVKKYCPSCKKGYCVLPSQTTCPLGHLYPLADWPPC